MASGSSDFNDQPTQPATEINEAVSPATPKEAPLDVPEVSTELGLNNMNDKDNKTSANESTEPVGVPRQRVYHAGWRLHALTAG